MNRNALLLLILIPVVLLTLVIVGLRTLVPAGFGGNGAGESVAFINGRILTMDVSIPVADALIVNNGRITAIGSDEYIKKRIPANINVIDLQQKTLMPGFVDAHSHFPASGLRRISIDLSSPPSGTVDSIDELLARIADAASSSPEDQWLLGFNYDNTLFHQGRHPTRTELDKVAPNHAVYLWHHSGHMGVANSRALLELGIGAEYQVPPGGQVGRDVQSGELNGLLQEAAAPPLSSIIKTFGLKKQLKVVADARDEYLAAGVTTAQNGFASRAIEWVLRLAKAAGLYPQRMVIWPAHGTVNIKTEKAVAVADETDFHVGAIKIIVDGSPQGMTAFLSQPYFTNDGKNPEYQGVVLYTEQQLVDLVHQYHEAGYQLALHGNGDQAIDYIINALSAAQRRSPRDDLRHILVHAQTIRKDQLQQLSALPVTPSFFVSHTYYWGDWHRTVSLGPDRAANISPTGWADTFGIRYSLHTDAPVTPVDPWQLVWSATSRQTRSGVVLGEHQRISRQRALHALTIDAAWQNHIDDVVGSLVVGKFADMLVLSAHPYEVDDIRKIQVLKTFIGGVEHYSLTSTAQ